MKVTLLFPGWTGSYGIFGHFARGQSGRPPLGLAYLAAGAKLAGHQVSIIDGQLERLGPAELADRALKESPDIIGITATSPFWHVAREIAIELREMSNTPLVIGGPHVTLLREATFDEVFDYGFLGEADVSFPAFLEAIAAGRSPDNVKGILFRTGGAVKFTGMPERVDITSLPFPARSLLKNQEYFYGTPRGKIMFANIMASRGCPYKCVYCASDLMGKKVRKRLPESVVIEMRHVNETYRIGHFLFEDDNLTIDRSWTLRFCELLESSGLDVTFEGCTRADLLDEELIERMAGVGLVRLMMGLESADPEVRRIINKDIPLELHENANRLCRKHGIGVLNFAMLGLPGETREKVQKTIDYLRHARDIDEATFSIATPYPGTELMEMAKRGEHGLRLVTDDYSQYKRYGSAVLAVNDLSPGDLVRLQNDGLAEIYMAPWRWAPMFHKSGAAGLFLTALRFMIMLAHRLSGVWKELS